MSIGNRLRQAMHARNIRQADLSEKSGVSQSLISDYCNDKKVPSLSNARAIAEALGVSLDELADRDPTALEGVAAHFDDTNLPSEALEEYNQYVAYLAFKYRH